MGLFAKKPIVLRWSPESDSTWEKQKLDATHKPMKHIRCGGVSVMIASLGKTPDGKLVTDVSVSNYEENAVGFNSGGFGLICGEIKFPCTNLKVQRGKPDFLHPETLGGKEVGFRDVILSQFENASFTVRFDAPVPAEAFVLLVEAKRRSSPNIVFVTQYEKRELADWGQEG